MVKHTQTIRRLLPTNCLSVIDHFVKLALKGLKYNIIIALCLSVNYKYIKHNFTFLR